MDLIPFFSTAILVATITSIVLAVTSYVAYKLRDRKRPNREFDPREMRDVSFFHRYNPPERRATGTDGVEVEIHDA